MIDRESWSYLCTVPNGDFSQCSLEGDLARSEERFRLLVDAVHDYAIVMLDAVGYIICWNAGAARLTGYSAEEMLGHHVSGLYSGEPTGGGTVAAGVKTAMDGEPWQGERWQGRKDGTQFLAHIVIVAVRDELDHVIAFSHVTQDITQQKHADETLRRSEGRFRMLSETVPGMIFTTSPDGNCDYANSRFYEYTGLPHGAANGMGWTTALHPLDVNVEKEHWSCALETGKPLETTFRFKRADGAYRWFLVRCHPLHDDEGRITQWAGSCMDIEDLKKAEEGLQLAQMAANAGLWDWDLAEDKITWSKGHADLYGLPQPSLVLDYQSWLDRLHVDHRQRVHQTVQDALERHGEFHLEFPIIHPRRGLRWVLHIGRVFLDIDQRPARMAGITLDITTRKQSEEEIRKLNDALTARLAELQDQIQVLEQFQDAVVGRELKMIGLEKQMARLQDDLTNRGPVNPASRPLGGQDEPVGFQRTTRGQAGVAGIGAP